MANINQIKVDTFVQVVKAGSANIKARVVGLTEKKVRVVLLGMQAASSNGPAYAREFNALYGELAKKYTTELVPFFLKGVVLRPSLNIADGIHPNKEGYGYIVENHVVGVVKEVLGE
jgi:acyl-CoA thioesterase-1